MTSKTFKSVLGTTELEVSEYADSHAGLFVSDEDGEELSGFYFDPSTAPALALVILEAAGIADTSTGGHITDDRLAVSYLKLHIAKQERITAEAKERAELEAEAFKLRRAYLEGRAGFDSWNELTDSERDHWLAVARKAREMRAEK